MNVENIRTVCIAGAGTMGQGIAQVCALAGFDVLLHDVKVESVHKALAAIETSLRKSVEKDKITEEQKKQTLSRINVCETIDALKGDLIIEAAIENLQLKRELFQTLEKINTSDILLATNTSSISITQIASVLKERSRFAGLHFFNPASAMKLVEVIRGADTASATVETLRAFSEKLGKTCVVAKDSPGFIVNRVARHYYVEALKMLEENSANIQTIDKLLKASGFKMGAFELMDVIGNDVNFAVTNSIFNAFHQNPKFRPSIIQQQKVDAGHLGLKSGKGFYSY